MDILGEKYIVKEPFDRDMFVPDCWVKGPNKIGGGHGEGKFYIGSKDQMRGFYGSEGFEAKCFILKSDLLTYMQAIKSEYLSPTQAYRGGSSLRDVWDERLSEIKQLDDKIPFIIYDQTQIEGPRGYVNSTDSAFNLLREISLPNVSYIRALRVSDKFGNDAFYWKLFVDYEAIEDKTQALVNTYGKKKSLLAEPTAPYGNKQKQKVVSKELSYARIGQGKYREALLEECPYCPITLINDERLLIASHIKPWAVSTNKERLDSKNGYMLSPLYDRLFDRGLITFSSDRKLHVSNWISPKNVERMNLQEGKFYQQLPMDEERAYYLDYHREFVFKG